MAIRSGRAGHARQAGGHASDTRGPVGEVYENAARRPRPALLTRAFTDRHVPGTGGPLRYLFSGIWLVYLVEPVSDLFGHRHGALWIAGGLAIAVAFCAIYVPILVNVDRWPRLAQIGLGAIALLAAVACVVYGQDWTPLWIYVSAFGGMVLAATTTRRVALIGLGVIGACYTFFSWLSHLSAGNFLAVLLPVLLIGLAMMGFRMQIELMHELAQARRTAAKLAASEERLRLARDMHDLTEAADQAARLRRTRRGAHRAGRHRPGQPADAARHQGGGQRLP